MGPPGPGGLTMAWSQLWQKGWWGPGLDEMRREWAEEKVEMRTPRIRINTTPGGEGDLGGVEGRDGQLTAPRGWGIIARQDEE